jgi:hypothetical protein
MKKIGRILFLAVMVIPILTISAAKANAGKKDGDKKGDKDCYHHGDNDPGTNPGGTRAPLDGGLSLLLAAGVGLGVKKAMQKNKARKEGNEDIS